MRKADPEEYPSVCVVMLHVMDGGGFAYLPGEPIRVVVRSLEHARIVVEQDYEQGKPLKWFDRGAWVECHPIGSTLRYYTIHEVALTYS